MLHVVVMSGIVPQSSLTFMTLTRLKVIGYVFCRISLRLGLFDASPTCISGRNVTKGCRVLIASCRVVHNFYLPHDCDVNFDSLLKVVSARLLCYKVILFPFVTNRYLVGRYFGTL